MFVGGPLGLDIREAEAARPDDFIVLDDRDRHAGDVCRNAGGLKGFRKLFETHFERRFVACECEWRECQAGRKGKQNTRC